MTIRLRKIYAALACLLWVSNAMATDAGSVLFVQGSLTAEREQSITLVKGDTILVADTVATGQASRAQLLMLDGAKIALRASSSIRIEEFVYSGDAPPAGQAVISSADEKSIATLVKGGFRTITGAIGKENKESYEVRTAVGVLGIRGTDYSAVFCNGDCAAGVEDGLYLSVAVGAIVFRNEVRDLELKAGEYAFIPLSNRQPRRLTVPPQVFVDDATFLQADGSAAAMKPDSADPTGFETALSTRREADPSSAAPEDEKQENDDSGEGSKPPEQNVIAISPDGRPVDITGGEPGPQGNRSISFSTGPLDAVTTIYSATSDNAPGEYQLDFDYTLRGFNAPFPTRTGTDTTQVGIGTSATVETGFDSLTVLRWGRWSGGIADATLSDGTSTTIDLTNQSLHWVSGPEFLNPPVMPLTGTANYSLLGATAPTDNFGNAGVLGSATFDADFTNQRVTSTLVIDINASTWTASGTGNIGAAATPALAAHLFDGIYNNVSVDGIGGGGGVFSGFFSQPGSTSDPSFPGGVGMTYSLFDPNVTTEVSGALVFGNP